MQNCKPQSFPPAIYACSDSIILFIALYVLLCQHIPCADPFRAATFMLQTFQTTSKVPQVVVLYSVMSLEFMDSLIFQAFRCYRYQMALSHIYCNKFSFETFDVISGRLLLCYKSFKYCACQHYRSRDDTDAQRSDCLRSGRYKMVSEHTRTVGHNH